MRIIKFIKSLGISQAIGAWRRNEVRISNAKRGRVYAKKDGSKSNLVEPVSTSHRVTITATHYRNGEVIGIHKAEGHDGIGS